MPNDLISTQAYDGKARHLAGVSVVVPSYNHAGFVEQTLRSIFKQTFVPLELIVIDDGSRDESISVIEKTLRDCPFPCEFYPRENLGLCKTLNDALEKTKGEYFAYLGSDDVWLPNFLSHRVEALENDPDAVLAYGRLHVINTDNEIIGEPFDFDRFRDLSTRDKLLYGFAPTSSGILYRKRFLLKHRWNSDIKLEDYDLYLRLCMEGEFIFDESKDAAWRFHESNTSSGYEFMMCELIDAIKRNAATLGLDDREVKALTSAKKIAAIDKYLADRKRMPAIRLFMSSLSGFPSKVAMARKAMKILAPMPLIEMRTNHVLGKALQKTNFYINEDFTVAPVVDPAR